MVTTSRKNCWRSRPVRACSPSRASVSCCRERTRTSRLTRCRSLTSRHMPSTCAAAPSCDNDGNGCFEPSLVPPRRPGEAVFETTGLARLQCLVDGREHALPFLGREIPRNDRERALKTLLGPAANVLQVRRPRHSVRPEIPAPHTDATGIECGTKCLEFCKCTRFTHNGLLRFDPFLIGMRFRHVHVRAKCLCAKFAGLGELDTALRPMHDPARIKGWWPAILATRATCLYKPKAFQMFLKAA